MSHPKNSVDPDPIVIDLFINLLATGIAGMVVKAARRVWSGPAATSVDGLTSDQLKELRRHVDELDATIDRAAVLVDPGTKRELGAQLLLSPNRIREYHSLRNAMIQLLGDIDKLAETAFPSAADVEPARGALPAQLKSQIAFLEKRLREARVASLAEDAILESKAIVVTLRRMLEHLIQDFHP